MTARARITQADIERILKAAKNAGWPEIRLTIKLTEGIIDVACSGVESSLSVPDEWTDDD